MTAAALVIPSFGPGAGSEEAGIVPAFAPAAPLSLVCNPTAAALLERAGIGRV